MAERAYEMCSKHKIEMTVESDCSTCHGSGEVEDDEGGVTERVTCWRCRGSCVSPWLDCEMCIEESLDDI